MGSTARILAAPASMVDAIRAAARAAPMLCLTGRAFADLAAELGGMDTAVTYLLELAESIGKPLGINFETGAETSRTAFIGPRSWPEDKLAGWIAGHHAELEAEFGQVARVGTEHLLRGGGI